MREKFSSFYSLGVTGDGLSVRLQTVLYSMMAQIRLVPPLMGCRCRLKSLFICLLFTCIPFIYGWYIAVGVKEECGIDLGSLHQYMRGDKLVQ